MRIQARLPKGLKREPSHSGLHPRVKRLMRADAKRFDVSLSFVQATIITTHYEQLTGEKFPEQQRYYIRPVQPRAKRRA